jgi:uncharacterized damage-inducible protein DinB
MDNMRIAAAFLFCATYVSAQSIPNPLVATSQGIFAIAKDDVLKSADKIPENLWSFKPTPEVRTIGQLFAHIADAQYEFCGPVAGGKAPDSIEENVKTKAGIVAALNKAFAYCDSGLAQLNDTTAVQIKEFFGRKMTALGLFDFNTAHTMEHYGNLVTYMRLKGIVPPSSTPAPK